MIDIHSHIRDNFSVISP